MTQFLHNNHVYEDLVDGYIAINADGSVNVAGTSLNKAMKVPPAKTANAGEYVVTLDNVAAKLISSYFQVNDSSPSPADLVAQRKSEDVAGAGTVTFRLLTGATPTTPSHMVGVAVSLFLSRSKIA